jgi:hypothetical protein
MQHEKDQWEEQILTKVKAQANAHMQAQFELFMRANAPAKATEPVLQELEELRVAHALELRRKARRIELRELRAQKAQEDSQVQTTLVTVFKKDATKPAQRVRKDAGQDQTDQRQDQTVVGGKSTQPTHVAPEENILRTTGTVSPKARLTPAKPIPNSGKPAASTAEPQPPNTSQNVPINSAANRLAIVGTVMATDLAL